MLELIIPQGNTIAFNAPTNKTTTSLQQPYFYFTKTVISL